MSIMELESKARTLKELKIMAEELAAEITTIEDEIKASMGTEEILIAGPYKVTWKSVTSSRVDTTALKKAHPDIAAQFTKATTSRRFLVN